MNDNVISWTKHVLIVIVSVTSDKTRAEAHVHFGPFESTALAKEWFTRFDTGCKRFWSKEGHAERFEAMYGDSFTAEDGSNVMLFPMFPGHVHVNYFDVQSAGQQLAQHIVWDKVINPKERELDEILAELPAAAARNALNMIELSFR